VRFRVVAPVSLRAREEDGTLGNRVSLWLVELPVGERSASRRLEAIRGQTGELKRSKGALGAGLLTQGAEWSSSTLLSLGARAATRLPAFNAIVTNVPGPQIPLYLAGARLLRTYPVAPLLENVALNVALMSYDGQLCWGLNADYDRLPDLSGFRSDLEASFAELSELARERREGAARKTTRRTERKTGGASRSGASAASGGAGGAGGSGPSGEAGAP